MMLSCACVLGLALLPAAPAPQAQDSLIAGTARLRVALDPVSGALDIHVLHGGGNTHTTHAPGMRVAGAHQAGLQPAGDGRLRTDAVELALEVLGERSIAATWTVRDGPDRELELHLRSRDVTRYYGTGERYQAIDQRGYILPVVTDDRYGNKGVGTHKPVPFFMDNDGLGVWVDTWSPGTFDLSGTERFGTILRFTESRLRVVFMAGADPAEVLEVFTAHTGRSPVPPPWAFGLWKSRDIHHTQDSVFADIERLREHGIPASVLVLDSPWETGYNTFVVNRGQFPDADSMFARIRALGFETCLWLTPFINHTNVQDAPGVAAKSANYDEAAEAGHLVETADGRVADSEWWKGTGGLVDFTDPAARAWWLEQLRRTQTYGARCFKVDDGEGNFVPDAVFHDGTPARLMKNRYAVLYDSVMQAYIDEELAGNGVLIVRSAHTGAQKTPFAWAGDNEGSFSVADGLPSVVLAGQNAALSGISLWGSDIAGYAGRPSRDVFIRWTQFAAFCPFMQVHMTSNLGPWDFDRETLEIFRAFTVLRTRLFPYLYDAVHETAATGLPVIRPMVLAFPEEPELHSHVYQYMYGPDILVAPVVDAGTRRTVALPSGAWVDFWSGAVMAGGRVVEVDAPLDRMPLFVRAGAVLPQLPADVLTLVTPHDALDPSVRALAERRVVEVWPGEAGAFDTWDGLRAERQGTTLRVSAEPARPVAIRFAHRSVTDVIAPGAEIVRGDDGVVVRFERLAGDVVVRWTERAR